MSLADAAPGLTPGAIPPEGGLEELDGTPIRPPAPAPRPPAIAWRRAAAAAARATVRRPRLWTYALVAFLARGGILLLALPIVVLPTFIGIANFVGPASGSAEGPGPRLVAILVAGVFATVILALAGTLLAAAAEAVLLRSSVAEGVLAVARPPAGLRRGVVRIAAVRLALLVPVVAVAAAAVPAWIGVAYRELTLPSDVTVPLVLRILAGAPAASVAVLAAWLAGEVVGGFAARRAVILDASVPHALAAGSRDTFRAPIGTCLSVGVALAASGLLLVPAIWAVGGAWDLARRVLGAAAVDPLPALGAALLLAGTWLLALIAAGATAAWRATLLTAELLRRRPAGAVDPDPAAPTPAGPSRHAPAGRSVG